MGHGHGPVEPTTWGRGIRREIKQTICTHWCKEMTNLNLKTIAVSFFLYLACVAPAITFGAIYAKLVGNWMGAVETLACRCCGRRRSAACKKWDRYA